MPTKSKIQEIPYFKSIVINNYRNLRHVNLHKLSRVNIIGGMNGVGKTSLLESIFILLDRVDPMVLIKPAIFRNFVMDFDSEGKRIFSEGDSSRNITIAAHTKSGREQLTISSGALQEPLPPINVPLNEGRPISPTIQATSGLTVSFSLNQHQEGKAIFFKNAQGIMTQVTKPFSPVSVRGSFISPSSRYIQPDLAERFTEVVQAGQLEKLVEAVRVVQPKLTNLQLLQVSGQALIHGNVGVGQEIPINMLGDGALTIACIVMHIIATRGGVLLIDEFDAAVHFSVLRKIWYMISTLSAKFNAQLFVTTHSRECIQAANDGFVDSGRQSDLGYCRLDRIDQGVSATIYEPNELDAALKAEWEIR